MDLILLSGLFRSFYLTKIKSRTYLKQMLLSITIHRKRQKSTKVSTFSTFCGQFYAIFQGKSANVSLNIYRIIHSIFVEHGPTFCLQNDSKSTHKNEDIENFRLILSHYENFFEAKRCNVFFKSCNA